MSEAGFKYKFRQTKCINYEQESLSLN